MIKEKNTLLEKAKLIKIARKNKHLIDEQKMELGLAWAKEEISISQLIEVLEFKSQNKAYTFLSNCFKTYINYEFKKL
jgi:hypothetical protein